MTNREIKLLMRAMGVPQWKLAKAFGVHHETVSRMLRDPDEVLSAEKQQQIFDVINEVSKQGENLSKPADEYFAGLMSRITGKES